MLWAGDPAATPVEAVVHCFLSRTVCVNRMARVSIMFTIAHSGRKNTGILKALSTRIKYDKTKQNSTAYKERLGLKGLKR
jgi:hypothetical protein